MLSISRLGGNLNYYLELATAEYYLKGGEPPGVWIGTGAAALGLCGQIDPKQFENVAKGFSPDGERKLVQNAGKEERRIGWDLTFSAPKSVSVLWAVSPEPIRKQIQKAHFDAVQTALTYLEEKAAVSRIGKGGRERTKASLVVGLFEHGTSRAGDPQLHSHALVTNLGVDGEGKTRTILSRPIYQQKMIAGAVYRLQLGHHLIKELGVRLVPDQFSFRIKGISEKVCEHYSKRRKEVEEKLAATSQSSAKASQIATLETRRKKETRPRQDLLAEWQQECGKLGLKSEHVDRLFNRNRIRQHPLRSTVSAVRNLAARHSYFSEGETLLAAATQSQHEGVSVDVLRRTVADYLNRGPQTVALDDNQFTTKKNLKIENELLGVAADLAKENRHQVPVQRLEKKLLEPKPQKRFRKNRVAKQAEKMDLTWEQSAALAHLTISPGAIQIVEGKAGTGKTELLRLAHEIWKEDGLKVYGACISGKAARGLQQATGMQSETVAKVLYDVERSWKSRARHTGRQLYRAARKWRTRRFRPAFQLDSKSVLVLDEAAMIGTQDLNRLFKEVKQTGAKVVLIGDSLQIQPIAPGNPFSSLAKRFGSVRIDEIKRQRDAFDRQVVQDLSEGKIESALRSLVERGKVHLAENREQAMLKMVQDWADANRPQDPIFVTTRAEVAKVNLACHRHRKRSGQLKRFRFFRIDRDQYHVGDRILFLQRDKRIGVENGDFATILKINNSREVFTAKLDDGTKVLIPLERYQAFSHGYATTIHKGQGATVENSFVLLGGKMQDRFLSYVQMSRARGNMNLYLDRFEAGPEFEGIISQMKQGQSRTLASDVDPHRRQQEIEQSQRL